MEMFRVSSQATQAQTSPFQQWQQTTADIAGSARQQDQRLIARHIEEAFLSVSLSGCPLRRNTDCCRLILFNIRGTIRHQEQEFAKKGDEKSIAKLGDLLADVLTTIFHPDAWTGAGSPPPISVGI
jgi:hypothetical protein